MLASVILGLMLATCSFLCGISTDMSAVIAPDERRSRLFGTLAACALGLLVANVVRETLKHQSPAALDNLVSSIGTDTNVSVAFESPSAQRWGESGQNAR